MPSRWGQGSIDALLQLLEKSWLIVEAFQAFKTHQAASAARVCVNVVEWTKMKDRIAQPRQHRPLKAHPGLPLELSGGIGQMRRERIEIPAQFRAMDNEGFAEGYPFLDLVRWIVDG